MDVIFRRTGQRRYAIEVRRARFPAVEMNPAPGYDPLVPHDLLHLVVEAELSLTRGIFGQLAAGGHAGGFRFDLEPEGTQREAARRRRRVDRRSKRLRREGKDEAAQSERAAYICWYEWLARSESKPRRALAKTMVLRVNQVRNTTPAAEVGALTENMIMRICRQLDELSSHWSRLGIGESMTVRWPDLAVADSASTYRPKGTE